MACPYLRGWLALLILSAVAHAQLPNPALDFIYPPGGQAGTTCRVQTGGRDLDDGQRLIFSHPGISSRGVTRAPSEFESSPQPVPGQYDVDIAVNVPPGIYDVRAFGRYGVSTPRSFVVGDVPEQQETGAIKRPKRQSRCPWTSS